MDYFITISEEASSNIKSTIDYLKREWSEKSVLNFQNDLLNCLDRIISNPLSFRLVDIDRGIRKSKVSKYSSAYFRIKENEIEIITVFDHRRDPERLKELFQTLK
jgi:plasmid stabilization system protein ParE